MPRIMHSCTANPIRASLSPEASLNVPDGAFLGRDLPHGWRCVNSVLGGGFATCRSPKVFGEPLRRSPSTLAEGKTERRLAPAENEKRGRTPAKLPHSQ
jgi:hypothetical protein